MLVNNFNGNNHSCMLGHLHVIISISHYNLLTLLLTVSLFSLSKTEAMKESTMVQ